MSSLPDWSQFTLRIFINKPLKDLYNAWTIPSQLSTWFLEKADYKKPDATGVNPDTNIEKGDLYTWKWNNYDILEEGEVLTANGKDEVAFTFGKAGSVHVTFTETDRGTEVKLVQDNIPIDDESKKYFHTGCTQGWTFWLANLKAWMEHGILLNQKGLTQEEARFLANS